MRFDLVTIFPEFFAGPLDHGIVRRARESGIVEVRVQDLREFTKDRHRSVDDRPFGGGEGMLLKPEPLFEAAEALLGHSVGDAGNSVEPDPRTAILLLSASGRLFRQEKARSYARCERVILLCGRYEGVDERVAEHLATEELSVGDFVLSGGELAGMMVIDAVTRLLPGALGNEASSQNESFGDAGLEGRIEEFRPARAVTLESVPSVRRIYESLNLQSGLLDCPHYTRPAEYRGWPVPEVLLSGNHEQIRAWRQEAALRKTLRNRPDLLGPALLRKAGQSAREG
ncbi:MAG TPA: tRNA (guanosine(37)-N1)-methyltransferase TrmD [Candidatus Acidoferrum sp.]|nr:tRNA (guanosine(37)-N1)-methyltransferase TrmD [Candidatus Acidoferrum sp.]